MILSTSVARATSWMSKLGRAADLCIVLACLLLLSHTAYFTWKYFSSTPFWDFWNWIADYRDYVAGHYNLHELVKPHNEHRIVTTRLVLFADAIFFHMTGRFVVTLNLLLLIVLGWALNALARTRQVVALRAGVPAIVTIALMASTCQWFNLVLPFQIQFALLSAAMLAGAVTAAKATSVGMPRARQAAWAVLAGLCYFAASFSVAGGLLELPWLLLLFWLRASRRIPAALFAAIAAAAAFLFLHDYHPIHGAAITLSAKPAVLADLLRFTAGVLGSAFYAFEGRAFLAGYIGVALFVATGTGILHATIVRRANLPGRTLVLFTLTGTLATMAAAAAVSRLSLGADAALAPRYATLSLIFWASLVPLFIQYCVYLAPESLGRRIGEWRLPLVLAAAALAACNLSPRYSRDAREMNSTLASQAIAMRQNVYVPDLFSQMYYGSVAEASDRLVFLHTYQLGVFAPGAGRLPASISLPKAAEIASLPSCSGQIEQASRLDATRFIIGGWVGASNNKGAADWVALLTPDNALVTVVPATQYRTDLGDKLHTHTPPLGIHTGISDPLANAGDHVTLRVVGLFANAPARTCLLPAPLVFGPYLGPQKLNTITRLY